MGRHCQPSLIIINQNLGMKPLMPLSMSFHGWLNLSLRGKYLRKLDISLGIGK